MADEAQGTPGNAPPAPSVAGNGKGPVPPNAPIANGAAASAPLFGGLRGGRKRDDGLIPGSPEAAEADRKRDAERKRKQRKAQPAPLPSAAAGAPGPSQAPGNGLAVVPGPETVPVELWTPEMLQPLFEQGIPALEEYSIKQISDKAAEAKLPGAVIHEIQKDAAWHPLAKKGLEISGPRVGAKWLNKIGIPAGYQDEGLLLLSLIRIGSGYVSISSRLDKLIELQTKASNDPKPSQNPAPQRAP